MSHLGSFMTFTKCVLASHAVKLIIIYFPALSSKPISNRKFWYKDPNYPDDDSATAVSFWRRMRGSLALQIQINGCIWTGDAILTLERARANAPESLDPFTFYAGCSTILTNGYLVCVRLVSCSAAADGAFLHASPASASWKWHKNTNSCAILRRVLSRGFCVKWWKAIFQLLEQNTALCLALNTLSL